MKVGDLVKRSFFSTGNAQQNYHGIITKVYESRIKTTVEVMWIGHWQFGSYSSTIEPYYLVKLS